MTTDCHRSLALFGSIGRTNDDEADDGASLPTEIPNGESEPPMDLAADLAAPYTRRCDGNTANAADLDDLDGAGAGAVGGSSVGAGAAACGVGVASLGSRATMQQVHSVVVGW